MKKIIVLSSLLITSSFFLLGFVTKNSQKAENKRTEEYAMIDVVDQGIKKVIRITIGEEPAEEVEWKVEKTEKYGDFTPVMKQLHILNEKGFELVNSSIGYSAMSGNLGNPTYTFMLKKKL